MDQILIYWWVFVAVVVSVVNEAFEWLRPHGFSSGVFLFAIATVGGFIIYENWSVGVDLRIQAIETRLGIEHKTPKKTKKITWWGPLLWVSAAAYLMGKSINADGLAFFIGTAISGLMLLMFVFGAYCLMDQAIRDYFRKPDRLKEDMD